MSSHLIRSDLVPILTGYILLMAVLGAGLVAAQRRLRSGRPLTRHTGRRDSGWPALIWHMLADALGGYLLLAVVVVLYYYFVARVGSNFLESEFSGAALLLAIALPVFLLVSWLVERRSAAARRASRKGNGQPRD
jgi:small-conductance mechanosensitive channel